MDYPPYSPDLAPSDFYLFGPLKQHLGGTKFETEEKVITCVKDYFKSKRVQYYETAFSNYLHDGRNAFRKKAIM